MPRLVRLLVDRHLRQHPRGMQLASPLRQRARQLLDHQRCLLDPWRGPGGVPGDRQVLDHQCAVHGQRPVSGPARAAAAQRRRLQHRRRGRGRDRDLAQRRRHRQQGCRLPSQQHGVHGSQSDRREPVQLPGGQVHHADHQRHRTRCLHQHRPLRGRPAALLEDRGRVVRQGGLDRQRQVAGLWRRHARRMPVVQGRFAHLPALPPVRVGRRHQQHDDVRIPARRSQHRQSRDRDLPARLDRRLRPRVDHAELRRGDDQLRQLVRLLPHAHHRGEDGDLADLPRQAGQHVQPR